MATPLPENQAPFSLAEILEATGGKLVGAAVSGVSGVTTDSRARSEGKLFVALRGERFDGHAFVSSALRAGARAALVERSHLGTTSAASLVVVDDTLEALGKLARHHLRRSGATVVAVGGSAGKTTTRAAIASALRAVFGSAVLSSPGNLNNRVGVPLVLLGLTSGHRYAVVEVGTNQRGEVSSIARIAEPQVAVLTRIALEHTEGLGDLDGVEREEGELLQALPPTGVAIANGDDPRALRQLELSQARTRILYGIARTSSVRIDQRRLLRDLTTELEIACGEHRFDVETTLLGPPGALAVAAALAVVSGIAPTVIDPRCESETAARERLRQAFRSASESGRLCPVWLSDGTLVLDDTYNANPASVVSSLGVAREVADLRESRLLCVLGEMRELGAHAVAEHEAVGHRLAELSPDRVITIGEAAHVISEIAGRVGIEAEHAASAPEAEAVALASIRAGDTVLIKASRGVRAESLVTALLKTRGRAA